MWLEIHNERRVAKSLYIYREREIEERKNRESGSVTWQITKVMFWSHYENQQVENLCQHRTHKRGRDLKLDHVIMVTWFFLLSFFYSFL